MKTQLIFQRAKTGDPKPNRPLNFKFAIVLACVFLGAALLLPAMKSAFGEHHRKPSGQFQAEVRTLIAEVRYLLTPETDHPKIPAPFDDNAVPIALNTPFVICATFTSSSNEIEVVSEVSEECAG
ncbi:MAG: hypothetical protein WDM80_01255 [Limisphaerales bacterium]